MKPCRIAVRFFRSTLVAAAFVASCGAASAGPVRAFYWNMGGGTVAAGPATDAAWIARSKEWGVSEVHLWLNDNRATPACGFLFQYQQGGATIWTPERLEQSTRALQAAGLKVVYTMSPEIRTESFIKSLESPGGPVEVASRIPGVDIELDIEGNGERASLCPGDGLSLSDADTKLVRAIRATAPGAKLIVSTTRKYELRHPILMAAADAISPQLYEEHYATSLSLATSGLNYYRRKYPAKPIWVGLSVECSQVHADQGHCSRALFESEVKLVADANAVGGLVPKYVIWAEREARLCPTKDVCSIFAKDYLAVPIKP